VTTLFSRIIAGELPGHFVWTDHTCVAFLSINPLSEGHTLVVPRLEVDDWLSASEELRQHLFGVAATVGRAIRAVFGAPRVGLIIAGFEVPHLHIHVFGAGGLGDFDFRQAGAATQDALAPVAARLRAGLA
jgi:histidine triad (HIT) family protein